MKFLVDAQLPRRLAQELTKVGHDAIHTLDLPLGNATPDEDLIKRAQADARILVTKDGDFVTSFLLRHLPAKLLLVTTGNISNDTLSRLFAANLPSLESAFAAHDFVELGASAITIHS